MGGKLHPPEGSGGRGGSTLCPARNHACGWITHRRSQPLALVRFMSWLTELIWACPVFSLNCACPGAGRRRKAVVPLKPRGAQEEGRTGRPLQSRAWMGSPEPTLLCGLSSPREAVREAGRFSRRGCLCLSSLRVGEPQRDVWGQAVGFQVHTSWFEADCSRGKLLRC